MKVCIIGLDLPEGKVKYHDEKFVELVKKCDPLKVTPFMWNLSRMILCMPTPLWLPPIEFWTF